MTTIDETVPLRAGVPDWLPAPDWSPLNAEYHRCRTHWSSSMLSTFARSPGEAFTRYVVGEDDETRSTPAMVLGSLAHVLVLEPENVDDEVHVVDVKGKTARRFKEAEAEHPDKLVVTAPEFEAALGIARAVWDPQTEAARLAHALIYSKPGRCEYSHRWTDIRTGVKLKCRFDLITETAAGPAVVHFKTTADPEADAFMRVADRLGYTRTAGVYERGFVELTGEEPTNLFVVVRNARPHEVAVYQASDDFMSEGRSQLDTTLRRLAGCLGRDDRDGWAADWETDIQTLDLVPWRRNRD